MMMQLRKDFQGRGEVEIYSLSGIVLPAMNLSWPRISI